MSSKQTKTSYDPLVVAKVTPPETCYVVYTMKNGQRRGFTDRLDAKEFKDEYEYLIDATNKFESEKK